MATPRKKKVHFSHINRKHFDEPHGINTDVSSVTPLTKQDRRECEKCGKVMTIAELIAHFPKCSAKAVDKWYCLLKTIEVPLNKRAVTSLSNLARLYDD